MSKGTSVNLYLLKKQSFTNVSWQYAATFALTTVHQLNTIINYSHMHVEKKLRLLIFVANEYCLNEIACLRPQ